MRPVSRTLTSFAALLALTCAACSGDDAGGGETETGSATTPTTTASTSATTSTSSISSTSSDETTTSTSSTSSDETTTSSSDTTTTGDTATDSDATTSDTTGVLPDDVPAPFNQYCVATFTEDAEPPYMFSIQAGESYLYIDVTFVDEHEMIYFHDDLGPVAFTIESTEPLPFTSNCDPLEGGTQYYAVLADVTIYNDEALSDPACELTAGTIAELEGGGGFTYVADVDGGSVYEYSYLSPLCPGVESGYVFVPDVLFFGANTQSFPIQRIWGP